MAGSWCSLNIFLAICFAAAVCSRGEKGAQKDETAPENLRKLAKSNNYLAVNMLHQLSSETTKNIFFSPLSLSAAFGMLYYGAKGKAAKELRKTLGYDNAHLPKELVHETFQEYLTTLESQDSSAYVLIAANSILLDKNLNVHSSYVKEVQNLYQASVKNVDFSSERQEIVQEVNSWVQDETNGKIKKLLDNLDPSTILVLLNAVYFKGSWETPFKPSKTKSQTFYNNGLESEAKKVHMMKLRDEFLYAELKDTQALEMPYERKTISMIILLPKERDGLESLENSLSLDKLSAIRSKLHKTNVHVSLPKFKITYSRKMSDDFQSLGANSIFAPGADFSGMTLSDDISVTEVYHKAVIEVNEEGSEAASATSIFSNRMGKPTSDFVVDHPFLFIIVDKRNGMILFLGRVTNL